MTILGKIMRGSVLTLIMNATTTYSLRKLAVFAVDSFADFNAHLGEHLRIYVKPNIMTV